LALTPSVTTNNTDNNNLICDNNIMDLQKQIGKTAVVTVKSWHKKLGLTGDIGDMKWAVDRYQEIMGLIEKSRYKDTTKKTYFNILASIAKKYNKAIYKVIEKKCRELKDIVLHEEKTNTIQPDSNEARNYVTHEVVGKVLEKNEKIY